VADEKVVLGGTIVAVDSSTKALVTKALLVDDNGDAVDPANNDNIVQVGVASNTADDGVLTQLTATSTPCKYAVVSAPFTQSTGAASNSNIVLVGTSGAGNQLQAIAPSEFTGIPIPCSNLNELYFKTANDDDGITAIAYGVSS